MSINIRDEPFRGSIPQPPRIRPTGFGRKPVKPHLYVVPPGDVSVPLMMKPIVRSPPALPISPLTYKLLTGKRD